MNTLIITLDILLKVWPKAKFVNLAGNETFEYVNIAKFEERSDNISNCLYFSIYELNPEKEGWYIDKIDRRPGLFKLAEEKPTWTFVIDDTIPNNFREKSKYIVVDNLFVAIKQLYSYKIESIAPKIVAITGSAGKTTTAVLVESVLETKYKCLRIFSKRITPYILFAIIINKLETDCEFIILEMGLYRKEHPDKLAKLLKPTYSIVINILAMHIGVNNIMSLSDIYHSKVKIIKENSVALLNRDDAFIKKFRGNNIFWVSLSDKNSHVFLSDMQNEKMVINILGNCIEITPFIHTKLFIYQCLFASCISYLEGIPISFIEKAINNFIPKENRVNKFIYRGYVVFFSALITHKAYLSQMSECFYADVTLIILKMSFGEDNPETIRPDLPIAFSKFTRVKIVYSEDNIGILNGLNLPSNTEIVSKAELFLNIPSYSIIFLHYGKYFAEHKTSSVDIEGLLA